MKSVNQLFLVCQRCRARFAIAHFTRGRWYAFPQSIGKKQYEDWLETHGECEKNEHGVGLGLHVRLERENTQALTIDRNP